MCEQVNSQNLKCGKQVHPEIGLPVKVCPDTIALYQKKNYSYEMSFLPACQYSGY